MTKTLLTVIAVTALTAPAAIEAQDPLAMARGAQVYAAYCASCHNARASSERTDLEWVAISLHMRARANFSKSQTSAVLAFLQATNLPETLTTVASAPAADRPTLIVVPEQLRAELLARVAEQPEKEKVGGNHP
jgi:mono/diheme cytochrome c family protein